MRLHLHKYHGAGNDFLLCDARESSVALSEAQVRFLCDRHTGIGADGFMLLEKSDAAAFRMRFFNPDGSGGMMCGNGGRCIAAFALRQGIPAPGGRLDFEAPDGPHTAFFPAGTEPVDGTLQVRLGMKDVSGMQWIDAENAVFLDTGTRHLVVPVEGLDTYPVASEGARLRADARFAPQGTNVDFIEPDDAGGLRIRTFEKGVEGETLACGTGLTASALAAFFRGIPATGGPHTYRLRCRRGDILQVDFVPGAPGVFGRVHLTGPAELVEILD